MLLGIIPSDRSFCVGLRIKTSWLRRRSEYYKGNRVLYIGEEDGCTATPEFHALLEQEFTEEETVLMPEMATILVPQQTQSSTLQLYLLLQSYYQAGYSVLL